MRKMANGLTARGFLQEEGVHYRDDSTATLLTNEKTIKIVNPLLAGGIYILEGVIDGV
jgi:hypothetical protein